MNLAEALRSHILVLPPLAKFAIAMAVIVGVPPLARRLRLPDMVGLLLFGVVLGPHVLGVFGDDRPIADFFADLGKLLLMFSAGLEIDIALFRQARTRAVIFGLFTTITPLLLGTMFGLAFRYTLIPAIVIGSLLASHTLLSLAIVTRLGAARLEPIIVTIGATVLSDTLSLIVFAICVSTYETGFSVPGLAKQLVEIAVFVPLILFGLSRVGAYALRKAQKNEDAYFVLMLGMMAVAGVIADYINLPGIVGAFLAGLAVNAAVREHPAKVKLEFLSKALFIPAFFIATGFLIDPLAFARSVADDFLLVAGIVGTLALGKWIAAAVAGRTFGYAPAARLTMWALTLPQVAATLAATLVAYDTFDAGGRRLLDGRMLHAVLVLMLVTSILGPVLTERFAPRMLEDESRARHRGLIG
jgi:Kef-type K+ transport system membrane component KefB